MTTAQRITRIISIEDTRDAEPIADPTHPKGERWVKIPGSGVERSCDRCGRIHEVHATVALEDGTEAVVGTGCMKAESAEVHAQLKAMTSAAKTVAKWRAEVRHARAEHEAANAAEQEIAALPLPEITFHDDETDADYHYAMMGTVDVRFGRSLSWLNRNFEPRAAADGFDAETAPDGFCAERFVTLVDAWRREQYRARGFSRNGHQLAAVVREAEKYLEKATRKMAKLAAG